ncbi:MAG: RidA family protein [Nitratireductor sp.]
MVFKIEQKLDQLGVVLGEPPKPLASYVGFVEHENTLFISGQLPLKKGVLVGKGLLGKDISVEDAQIAARQCAINILSQVKLACAGDWERITNCIRLGGFVASTPDFYDHPVVLNGASDFMGEVLGEKGIHVRAAVGVASLPLNACVEIEAVFGIKS